MAFASRRQREVSGVKNWGQEQSPNSAFRIWKALDDSLAVISLVSGKARVTLFDPRFSSNQRGAPPKVFGRRGNLFSKRFSQSFALIQAQNLQARGV